VRGYISSFEPWASDGASPSGAVSPPRRMARQGNARASLDSLSGSQSGSKEG